MKDLVRLLILVTVVALVVSWCRQLLRDLQTVAYNFQVLNSTVCSVGRLLAQVAAPITIEPKGTIGFKM
jgi:hypothetical protein